MSYEQIINDRRPNYIVETGTCQGGSSLFFRDCMDYGGVVITVDTNVMQLTSGHHDRIIYLKGSSLDPGIFRRISDIIQGGTVMVSLDSDHIRSHVFNELKMYSTLVTQGNHIVVDDTFLGEFDCLARATEERFRPDTYGNPAEAVRDFLQTTDEFSVDTKYEKFITMSPGGHLVRN